MINWRKEYKRHVVLLKEQYHPKLSFEEIEHILRIGGMVYSPGNGLTYMCVREALGMLSKEFLEEFWNKEVGDRKQLESSSLTQVFMSGPFGGFSIREALEYTSQKLGLELPPIKSSEKY
jgi:hypothetical protein